MALNVYVRLDLLDRVAKRISMIVCRNHVEIMAFAMIQSQATHANAHLVTLDSRAKRISTIANRHHAIEEHASMVTIPLHANVIQDILANSAKFKSMNANQVSLIKKQFFFFKFEDQHSGNDLLIHFAYFF